MGGYRCNQYHRRYGHASAIQWSMEELRSRTFPNTAAAVEKKKKKDVFTNQENDGSVLFISHKHIQVKSVLDSFKMLFLPKCYRNICEFYD